MQSLPQPTVQLYVPNNCDAVATALANIIETRYYALVETNIFKPFYYSALPVSGIAFLGSGYYAYSNLGGDTALVATLLFALFVAFRVFDLMSDWGMYSISLASYHTGTALRHASLAFSIIGSILLVVDLKTMRERAGHWFGVDDGSESLKKIGYGMLSIVLLEDLPQMIISIIYLLDISEEGRKAADDPIAITSLVLSGISMLINAFIGIRSLCQGNSGSPTFGETKI